MTDRRLCDVGEAGFLQALQAHLAMQKPGKFAHVRLGIGDDAAILTDILPGCVLCCDMLVEGVDFERHWAEPADIGHKAAAVNLSDLAAMGARPRGLLASLAIDPQAKVADTLAMLASLHQLGCAHGAPLIGGDLSKTCGPWTLSVTAVGCVAPEQALRRHQACVGDRIFVTGELGAAAAGLAVLQGGILGFETLARRQTRPTPHTQLGQIWAQAGCIRSATDVSDGLQKDIAHLLPTGLGVRLQREQIPMPQAVRTLAQRTGHDPWQWALSGGEDFELLVAIAPEKVMQAQACAQQVGVTLTQIGDVTADARLQFDDTQYSVAASGYDHFAS